MNLSPNADDISLSTKPLFIRVIAFFIHSSPLILGYFSLIILLIWQATHKKSKNYIYLQYHTKALLHFEIPVLIYGCLFYVFNLISIFVTGSILKYTHTPQFYIDRWIYLHLLVLIALSILFSSIVVVLRIRAAFRALRGVHPMYPIFPFSKGLSATTTNMEQILSGQKKPVWTLPKIILMILAVLIGLFFFFIGMQKPQKNTIHFSTSSAEIHGIGMQPNFTKGQIWEVREYQDEYIPNRGDVITFDNPRGQYVLERIIGLPGEMIMIQNNKIFINNAPLLEPYLPKGTQTEPADFLLENQPIKIPQNMYAVLGDNRPQSYDSRYFGFISKSKIIGQVSTCLKNCSNR